MTLANLSAFIGSGGVEVAQAGATNSVGRVIGLQRLFEKEFGNSVGIYRGERTILADGHFGRRAADRARGREDDDTFLARLQHRVQKGKAAFQVIAKILLRLTTDSPTK